MGSLLYVDILHMSYRLRYALCICPLSQPCSKRVDSVLWSDNCIRSLCTMVVHSRKYESTRVAGVSRRYRNGTCVYRLRVGRDYKGSFKSMHAVKEYMATHKVPKTKAPKCSVSVAKFRQYLKTFKHWRPCDFVSHMSVLQR